MVVEPLRFRLLDVPGPDFDGIIAALSWRKRLTPLWASGPSELLRHGLNLLSREVRRQQASRDSIAINSRKQSLSCTALAKG